MLFNLFKFTTTIRCFMEHGLSFFHQTSHISYFLLIFFCRTAQMLPPKNCENCLFVRGSVTAHAEQISLQTLWLSLVHFKIILGQCLPQHFLPPINVKFLIRQLDPCRLRAKLMSYLRMMIFNWSIKSLRFFQAQKFYYSLHAKVSLIQNIKNS